MAKTTKPQPTRSQPIKPQTTKPVNAPSKTGNESGKGRGNNPPAKTKK
jgi:hypothetical protein